MICCQYPELAAGCDAAFTIDSARVTFGRGCLAEVGERARALGARRVAVFTDARVKALPAFDLVTRAIRDAGLDVVVFDEVEIEPTDGSFEQAGRFASEARPDAYVSLGGGSVIDTCKAANLLATHGGPLDTWVNAPVGDARPLPSPLAPHVACPTTSGTGSEVTGIAIFDHAGLHTKTGIASPLLRPSEALVDPDVTRTLPSLVVAASGLDVLCHALESFTARPFNRRAAPERPGARPLSQGRNPWSDLGAREAMSLAGRYLRRAVADASDDEAREAMMWAATLAGVAFGNAGVHIPHAMAYAVAGLAHGGSYQATGYPAAQPMVPHGISVALSAPAVFRFTAETSPQRHRDAAARLGAIPPSADPQDAGEALALSLAALMADIGLPNGLSGVGYAEADVPRLVAGTLPQARLLQNAPRATGAPELEALFRASLECW